MTVLVDGGVVESFTDSSISMLHSPTQNPWPNGAATTRSFLPANAPFALERRGIYLSELPEGVQCTVDVADIAL